MIREWSRWEGSDRNGNPLEIDIAAPLTDGRVLTGAVKWNSKPLDARWHFHHLEAIDRLAASGIKWAYEARKPDSPLLYLAAGGFTKQFLSAARSSRDEVYCWSLAEVFKPIRRKRGEIS